MNKVWKSLKGIGKSFYKFLDKRIVTPISKLVFKISEFFKGNGSKIEKILNKPTVLLYVSLVFAVGIFFLVDSKAISLVENEAEVFAAQPVKLIYNSAAYVVENAPKTVDITLIGRKSDLYLAKQLGNNEVVLDLTDYGVGEHKVKLTYKKSVDSLNYKLDPSYVTISIKEKVAETASITYDLLNSEKLDPKLSVNSVELVDASLNSDDNKSNVNYSPISDVVIKGSEDSLKKVASVKALIDLNNDDLTAAGEYVIKDVPLVAYDENGKILDNVEIIPEKIATKITLSSYYVDVPIKVFTTGVPKTGYAISSINTSVNKIRVYGDQNVLQSIQYVPVTIDVDGKKDAKTYNVNISKPSGIRDMSETNATVSITFGKEEQKTISGVQVQWKNLGSGLSVNAKSEADSKVDVIIKGVSDVIDDIAANTIVAYVDLSGYTVGPYTVDVLVEGDDPRVQYLASSKISIVISK